MYEGNFLFWFATKKQWFVYDLSKLKTTIFNRLPKDIKDWFFTSPEVPLYRVINEINTPQIQGNNINMAGYMKASYSKPYAQFSENTKNAVNMILDYLKEVWCSGDENSYLYVLKWFAKMTKGGKNKTAIILKGPEGVGKSFFWEWYVDYVMGRDLFLKARKDVLTGKFNKCLCGKLFVVFEELPEFGSYEWSTVGSELRSLITETIAFYEQKNEAAFQATNLVNALLVSNDDSVPRSEGRRYFIADLSTKHVQDHEYYGNLANNIKNDEVGEAFYAMLYEIDITDFHEERDMPMTENKLNAISDRLCPTYKFLKDKYILKNLPVEKITVEDFFRFLLYKYRCQIPN